MIETPLFSLDFPNLSGCLWRMSHPGGASLPFGPPCLEIDGQIVTLTGLLEPVGDPVRLGHGPAEHTLEAQVIGQPGLTLRIVLQTTQNCPVIRFRYELHSDRPRRLTKSATKDSLTYLSTSLDGCTRVTEVQTSQFNELVHSFCLQENEVTDGEFANAIPIIGPILNAEDDTYCRLLAYEHGAQAPDSFLHFCLSADRTITLRAVKGNYYDGQTIDNGSPFTTIWMQASLIAGSQDDMAYAYREFVLRYMSANVESRKPYIFYNTWNFQERNKWWNNQTYLASMQEERILAEIDVAHKMGVDVFVLDTGWYETTGDWRVNLSRFPDGLKSVKARLDRYGMKLGLWFNPTVASLSSDMMRKHRDCLMTRDGIPPAPHQIWETPESQGLCLVSRYAEAFAQELIRLVSEVGVTYFKWDAIDQYSCDAAGHFHGTSDNTQEERADSYAFQLGSAMASVVNKLCAVCPEAIVDFDITEGERTVGLQFLSAGKYFLINNGPYNRNYDQPKPTDGNVNLFFYPGPARGWICRTPLTYDKWIPSVLLLTHYLPDDVYIQQGWSGPREVRNDANQWISLASLVLGQNGIWGDLLSVTIEGQERFGQCLSAYKQISTDITAAPMIQYGAVSASPEIYEKIDTVTCKGVVSIFASAAAVYSYITKKKVTTGVWHNSGVTVTVDVTGHAVIVAHFDSPGAKVVFFGTDTRASPP